MSCGLRTWLPLEEVLCLNGCDLGHGGEDVGTVGGGPFQAVAVVNLPVACFFVHVELNERKKRKKNSFARKEMRKMYLGSFCSECVAIKLELTELISLNTFKNCLFIIL